MNKQPPENVDEAIVFTLAEAKRLENLINMAGSEPVKLLLEHDKVMERLSKLNTYKKYGVWKDI